MTRFILVPCLAAIAFALNGCFGGCPYEFAEADSLIVAGEIPEFVDYRPCGGTDDECWALGEAIVTYTDGSVKSWTDTFGRREFFIRSGSFGSKKRHGYFDWNLHEAMGNAFEDGKEVESIRYLIELVNRHTGGSSAISVRTGICFEGEVQSEALLTPQEDPFILPHERDSCDLSRRSALKVEAKFARSADCPL